MSAAHVLRRCSAGGRGRLMAFALGCLVLPMSQAATDAAQAKYAADRAACLSGQSKQEQSACLKEAGAAYEASKRGGLQGDATGSADYRKNTLDRCKQLPAADRLACAQRIDGNGSSSGSAADGGILRESRMPVIGEPAASAASAP